MELHILNIDLFEGHISQMKFQVNLHYFSIFGKRFFDLGKMYIGNVFFFIPIYIEIVNELVMSFIIW